LCKSCTLADNYICVQARQVYRKLGVKEGTRVSNNLGVADPNLIRIEKQIIAGDWQGDVVGMGSRLLGVELYWVV